MCKSSSKFSYDLNYSISPMIIVRDWFTSFSLGPRSVLSAVAHTLWIISASRTPSTSGYNLALLHWRKCVPPILTNVFWPVITGIEAHRGAYHQLPDLAIPFVYRIFIWKRHCYACFPSSFQWSDSRREMDGREREREEEKIISEMRRWMEINKTPCLDKTIV